MRDLCCSQWFFGGAWTIDNTKGMPQNHKKLWSTAQVRDLYCKAEISILATFLKLKRVVEIEFWAGMDFAGAEMMENNGLQHRF